MQWLPCRGLCYAGLVRCGSGVRWTSVILVGLFGSWIFGSVECGRNCTGYDIKCVNGQCVDESQTLRTSKANDSRASGVNKTPKVSCQCDPLWSGISCEIFTCSGRMHLQSSSGVITDGTGNYTTDNKCTWLIDAGSNLPVRLRFKEFATECSWDHLYVFDGNSVSAPLIAVLSGMIIPQNSQNYVIPELIASSGSAYIYFYSDAAYNMSGFTIEYKYALCSNNCSGNGACLGNGSCNCNNGWTGLSCDAPLCPGNCNVPNGICQMDGCNCSSGFQGIDCSIPSYKALWTTVKYQDHVGMAGVASHSSFSYGKSLWLVGGYSFQLPTNSLRILRYDFEQNNLNILESVSSVVPAVRYGHSTVVYEDTMFMYGGAVKNTATDELWQFNFTSSLWSQVAVFGSTKPFATVGHTAQVFGSLMFVFFGHSPMYGFLNTVQCFSIENNTWSILATSGAIVKGVYGASSVFDSVNHTILIHGGYQSESFNTYSLSDSLLAFDPVNLSWKILRGSGQYKYLHSASLLGRYMFVFGGNTHNDTSISQGAKCYSLNFMAYDIDCDQWYMLDPPDLDPVPSRFGHSAAVYNDEMYVFGGFSGLLHSDLLVYKPGNCESAPKGTCLSMKSSGVSCVLFNDSECLNPDFVEKNSPLNNTDMIKEAGCPTAPPSVCEKEKFKACSSCVVNSQECVWCESECLPRNASCSSSQIKSESQCYANASHNSMECIYLHNCFACGLNPACLWNVDAHRCEPLQSSLMPSNRTCEASCFLHSSCENCTGASCMWCGSQMQCVESNAYVTSFPYGQCMEWTTQTSRCPATRCADLKSCASCQQHPSCGWCDDGTNTGLGQCTEGGLNGPATSFRNFSVVTDWYFTSCPQCQCNGHSECSRNSSVCLSCGDMTTGLNCEKCMDGFWGNPIVGGNCTACECNNQADVCNSTTGVCYCRTRGVVGDRCQECDKAHKYYGDPLNGGTCYYEMAIDWIFTFNLSSEENKYYTQINFMNMPPAKDKDVDFSISCSADASMNISVKTVADAGESFLFLNESCRSFTSKFSHKLYNFGPEYNTTFYVYVYNFQTPFTLQMYFSQNEQLDLFRFFITFFSCFFSLLLIAFVSWKLKQKYDQYRRGQRHIQEMAQMANRPFSSCTLEFDSPLDSQSIGSREQLLQRSSGRRKRECKATPITVEPLFGQKAAVLSVIVRMPKGDDDYTPSDQSGLAIGSALVTLCGHSRQASTDPAKPEKTNKHRKKADIITNNSSDII